MCVWCEEEESGHAVVFFFSFPSDGRVVSCFMYIPVGMELVDSWCNKAAMIGWPCVYVCLSVCVRCFACSSLFLQAREGSPG